MESDKGAGSVGQSSVMILASCEASAEEGLRLSMLTKERPQPERGAGRCRHHECVACEVRGEIICQWEE